MLKLNIFITNFISNENSNIANKILFKTMFNTRELAYIIWGATVFLVLLFSKKMRKLIYKLILSALAKKLLILYLFATVYAITATLFLLNIHLWNTSLFKDTYMWFLFAALPLMVKSIKAKSTKDFAKEIARPLFTISLIFEFILSLYTFELWIELLMIPTIVFLGGLQVFSKDELKYKAVNKAVNWLITAFSLSGIIAVCIHLVKHYQDYITVINLQQFLLPIFLSALFLPFLYTLTLYTSYENAFIVLKNHFKNPKIFKYALFSTMKNFNTDLVGLQRWRRLVFVKNIQTIDEIKVGIELIKKLQKRENSNYTVAENLGWSPYVVRNLLSDKGFNMPPYEPLSDDEYSSSSSYLEINKKAILSDAMTFSIRGTENVTTQLELKLMVYDKSKDDPNSLLQMIECSNMIYYKIFGDFIPENLEFAIFDHQDYSESNSFSNISVTYEPWTNRTNGYSLSLTITHNNHVSCYENSCY